MPRALYRHRWRVYGPQALAIVAIIATAWAVPPVIPPDVFIFVVIAVLLVVTRKNV
jgi:hypothetical protein